MSAPRRSWDDWVADGEAIRYHSPDDFGWDGEDRRAFFRTKAKGLDMIIRPSSTPDTASLFVGSNLIHIPKADAAMIAAVLLKAAGAE